MKRQKSRQARALAAANRRAWLQVAIGAAVSGALVAMVLRVVPIGSPAQMVRAQMGRAKVPETAIKAHTAPASPAEASAIEPTRSLTREAPTPAAGVRAATQPARLSVGFDQLAGFPFEVTADMVAAHTNAATASLRTLAQIPDEIKALNEKRVSVRGYMLPLSLQGELTTDFLILRNQSMCCYGIPPRITEWINVRMVGEGVKPIMDEPVTVSGRFHVGEVRENGSLVGIYRLEADDLKRPGQ